MQTNTGTDLKTVPGTGTRTDTWTGQGTGRGTGKGTGTDTGSGTGTRTGWPAATFDYREDYTQDDCKRREALCGAARRAVNRDGAK